MSSGRSCYEEYSIGFEREELGQILIELSIDFPEYRRPIGEAATTLLSEPRIASAGRRESYQWLALIAHEFMGLPAAAIRKAVTDRRRRSSTRPTG